jgi:hypothetical protein
VRLRGTGSDWAKLRARARSSVRTIIAQKWTTATNDAAAAASLAHGRMSCEWVSIE